MTKFKKYENYKNTDIVWLNNIPSHWEELPNRYFLKDLKSKVGNNSSQYTLLSLTKRGVIVRDLSEMKGKFPAEFNSYKIVNEGNLILCLFDIEETPRTVGLAKNKGMITGAYNVLEINNINPKFLTYFYIALDNTKELRSMYRGLRKTIKIGKFLSIKTPYPSIEEQDKIVNFIEHKEKQINNLIKKQKKLIELLEEKKKTIITEAVTKGLDKSVPMKDSNIDYIGQIPQNWQVIKLKYITLCNKYSLEEQTDKNKQINYIDIGSVTNKDGITDVQEMLFKDAPSRARRIVHTNDTIISTVRTYLKAIAYIDEKYDNYICSTGFAVITPKNNIDSKFLFYLLHSDKFICEVERISTGANYPAITPTKLINLKCLMPNIQEQIKIRKYVENVELKINKSIDYKNLLINKLKEYKKALISYAVTGQIDVRNYEILETDDNIKLEEFANISEDNKETISEVEYANN